MNTKTISICIGIVVVGILGWGVWYSIKTSNEPGKLDSFAQCLTEKGMKFYGAFWCPHCQAMKRLFGNSTKYLNYIECSTPNGQAQTQICVDNKIEGYPTWVFADGSRMSGEVKLSQLSEKTGCALPQ
jgi:thiol-disulfide isomerase/thioredoxin